MVRSNWETTDVAAMRIFAEKRASLTIPISDRAIARAIGVSAPRIADLFNSRHGVPTLQEFLGLCRVFDLLPSETIDKVMTCAQSEEVTLSSADDLVACLNNGASLEELGLVANIDMNRDLESMTPDE